MGAEFTIRPGQLGDIDALVRLNRMIQTDHVAMAPAVYRNDIGDAELKGFWEQHLTKPGSTVAVAIARDDSVAGAVMSELQDKPQSLFAKARRAIHVHQLVVEERQRRSGVADRLMAFVEQQAAQSGASEIRLEVWAANSAALSFYAAQGYDPALVTHIKKLNRRDS